MGFSPRKRARSEVPRISSWPADDGAPQLQGFAGYKAGMTQVIMVDDAANAPTEGMEVAVPVTVLETPPMHAIAVRGYRDTPYGLMPVTEAWADELDETLDRAMQTPDDPATAGDAAALEAAVEAGEIDEIRMLTHTLPAGMQNIPKRKPDVMETRVGGGTIAERLAYAMDLLADGGEHAVADLFRPGEYLDVIGVTKGKGTQGPVKRWGVQKRKGKHARQGWRRRIGTLGPWNPSRVRSTVPQQGQMGYHKRTELNKRLLAIGAGDEASVDGGFVGYGEVDGPHALIKGSVPGPDKRLLRLRRAVRPSRTPRYDPEIRHISTASNQG